MIPKENFKKTSAIDVMKDFEPRMTFGGLIQSLRLCNNIPQKELAEKLAVSKQYLSDIENGRKIPSLSVGKNILLAIGYDEILLKYLVRDYFREAGITNIEVDITIKAAGIQESDLNEKDLLNLIREIEFEKNSGNYLPIFHVRERLPKNISRARCDELLRSLRDQGKIQLSALQEGRHYTTEQISLGIPQKSGGPLFYIILEGF